MRTAIAIGMLVLVAACGQNREARDEGPRGSRDIAVEAFDRVELRGSNDVTVRIGEPAAVRAEGSERALERLQVRVEAGKLIIENRRGWFGSSHGAATVHVTAPSISGLAVAGSGDLEVERIEAPALRAAIAGSGDLRIAELRTEQAEFTVAGSGTVEAAGAARNARVAIAGSGNARLAGLEAAVAAVEIAGSGNVQLRATETADIRIVGSGNARVTGPAQCRVNRAGSGNAHCGDE